MVCGSVTVGTHQGVGCFAVSHRDSSCLVGTVSSGTNIADMQRENACAMAWAQKLPPADTTEDLVLQFSIGDKAVYPAQGVAEVIGVEEKLISGRAHKFYLLRILDTDMRSLVSVD